MYLRHTHTQELLGCSHRLGMKGAVTARADTSQNGSTFWFLAESFVKTEPMQREVSQSILPHLLSCRRIKNSLPLVIPRKGSEPPPCRQLQTHTTHLWIHILAYKASAKLCRKSVKDLGKLLHSTALPWEVSGIFLLLLDKSLWKREKEWAFSLTIFRCPVLSKWRRASTTMDLRYPMNTF